VTAYTQACAHTRTDAYTKMGMSVCILWVYAHIVTGVMHERPDEFMTCSWGEGMEERRSGVDVDKGLSYQRIGKRNLFAPFRVAFLNARKQGLLYRLFLYLCQLALCAPHSFANLFWPLRSFYNAVIFLLHHV
jgi:hypothetical protein